MPQTRRMLTSWSKGELSPRLDGHMDVAAYFEGAMTAENMLCSRQGGMFRRYGLRMVKEVKDSNQDTIVMAFEFSVDESYILEVGNLYIRVYKNRAAVLNAGVHVEIATPFVVADIRSIHTTLCPLTTSSDSWATVANQTVRTCESMRTGFNTWIRLFILTVRM